MTLSVIQSFAQHPWFSYIPASLNLYLHFMGSEYNYGKLVYSYSTAWQVISHRTSENLLCTLADYLPVSDTKTYR